MPSDISHLIFRTRNPLATCLSLVAFAFGLQSSLFAQSFTPTSAPSREHLLMDFGWKFTLGNADDQKADFNYGPVMSYLAKQNLGNPNVCWEGFDDSKWKSVDLPYDWGMDLPADQNGESSWGCKPLGRNFPATSIGWYRKTFDIPASDKGRRISIEFEGVCHDCAVEVNGFYVGNHFSGYTSFSFDITDFVHYGGRNAVIVRVDARTNEGWWYQGAGIYRNVWLTKTAPVHVPPSGTQVLTNVRASFAGITANTEVANDADQPADAVVQSSVLDDSGQTVGTSPATPIHVKPWERAQAASSITVTNPRLWSTETPYLYRLATSVKVGGAEVDRYETPFGIRTIRFDPNQGFLLNGRRVAIRGFCDHEEHVIVGTGVPDSIWTWSMKKLHDELGANAIRTSHNPPAPALLDACDRLGILVMDEQRLFSSGDEGLKQLDSFVRRDRNHPSVIIWSAGNEEWALQSKTDSEPVMTRLQQEFHRLDPSRAVTIAASNGGDRVGVNAVAEVRGINYFGTFNKTTPLAYHQARPQQPIIGTEESPGDLIKFMAAGNPWYSGGFVWTGFAYYGEAKWPDMVAPFGALDIAGFPSETNYDQFQQAWTSRHDGDPSSNSPATAIKLSPDRTSLNADGQDTAVINIAITDGQNGRVGNATNSVTVQLTGPGKILGVGNGDRDDHTSDKDLTHATFQGRAQVMVQATHDAGTINLQVTSNSLQSGQVQIETKAGQSVPYVP